MGKRMWAVVLGATLVAGVLTGPVKAQTQIPAIVQIDDPAGDANLANDQDNAYGTPVEGDGDHVGPADVGSATDLLKAWFTNTATEISLNFQTEGDPARLAYDTYFRFASNIGKGPKGTDERRGCLFWVASINGAAGGYTGETQGTLTDSCNVGEATTGALTQSPGPDGSTVTTITFARSYSPLLADGGTITAPFGVARVVYVGPTPTTAAVATMDNTQRGANYVLTSGGPVVAPEPKDDIPGKKATPGKRKGCDKKPKGKGKGKAKGCKKSQTKPAKCEAFTPGEAGKDKPTVVLTDDATEETPLEQTVTLDESIADADFVGAVFHASIDAFNIQVDTKKADAGLYALIEFPSRRDYDLNLLHTDGSYAARSRGFNPVVGTPAEANLSAAGHGGEPTDHSEKLVGIKTSDCGGWTLEVQNWLGEGGEFAVKLWLGEAKIDPQEPGKETPH